MAKPAVLHVTLWNNASKGDLKPSEAKKTMKPIDKRIPVMGLPGCVMYARRTIFDIVLPRIMTGEIFEKCDFDKLGEGGLCLNCEVCTFPNCGFGK